jgi:putative endonuclease
MKDLFVYMMANRSPVVLYTGVTINLEQRVWQHKHHVVEGSTKPIAWSITSNFPTRYLQ